MTTVIAVDLSLARTGLAVWRPQCVAPVLRSVETKPDQRTEARHAHIVGNIVACLYPDRPDEAPLSLVVMEQTIDVPGRGGTTLALAGLRAVVRYALYRRAVPIVEVNASTLKVYGTGNGRAGKDQVVLAAQKRLGHLVECANNDEADALWLLAMTLDQYRHPLIDLPKTHRRALAAVKWPAFTIEES